MNWYEADRCSCIHYYLAIVKCCINDCISWDVIGLVFVQAKWNEIKFSFIPLASVSSSKRNKSIDKKEACCPAAARCRPSRRLMRCDGTLRLWKKTIAWSGHLRELRRDDRVKKSDKNSSSWWGLEVLLGDTLDNFCGLLKVLKPGYSPT